MRSERTSQYDPIMATEPGVIEALRGIVGSQNVLDDPGGTERYRRDFTGRFQAEPTVVVRPESTEQVAAIVKACLEREHAIVPQGGNSSLVGGAVPMAGEVVVSTERMGGVESFTTHAGVMAAGAGTTLDTLQQTARGEGWDYCIDLASRGVATLGGTIATNAGGSRVVRYGDTRAQVFGVELVTGTGEVVSNIGGTLRDNTGYHLPSIVTGSEGTLGIVTRARVRLHPYLPARTTAVLRFDDEAQAAEAAESMRRSLPSVESIEIFFGSGLELVCSVANLKPPFPETAGGYLLVEVAGTDDQTEHLGDVVGALPDVADVAVAQDSSARTRLWQYVEMHNPAIGSQGIPRKLDVAVPPGALAELTRRIEPAVHAVSADAKVWLFGHGGESALHVNITGVEPSDTAASQAVVDLISDMDGTISSDYGIGRAKLPWVAAIHSPTYLALQRRLKATFDPAGIMNPGVLFPGGA